MLLSQLLRKLLLKRKTIRKHLIYEKPADGAEWKEKDFEGQLKKLEKEAEERLDEKIEDMKRNIAQTGK